MHFLKPSYQTSELFGAQWSFTILKNTPAMFFHFCWEQTWCHLAISGT